MSIDIEEIIEMIKDCKRLANSKEEAKKLEKEFIKNFKNEYKIIENNNIINKEQQTLRKRNE